MAQVILVDLVLAGDNAIVIGLFAATVPAAMRQSVILIGIAFAAVTRIAFALVTAQLLLVPGLLLIGGLLLSWVCWHLWRNLSNRQALPDPPREFAIKLDIDEPSHHPDYHRGSVDVTR
ncbi:MAG: hypothetical protein CM1200mP41_13550 [Gammaproteobacteria bacterium]|nr:MAG: hypothetical protein CM1200mP41_13550 [Gammaproteobacteria bacterium]